MSSVLRSHFVDVGESQRVCHNADLARRGICGRRKRSRVVGEKSSMTMTVGLLSGGSWFPFHVPLMKKQEWQVSELVEKEAHGGDGVSSLNGTNSLSRVPKRK